MPKQKQVILLLDTSSAFPRGLLSGIAKYSRLHGPWEFYQQLPLWQHPMDINYNFFKKNAISNLIKAGVDGIITREHEELEKEILARELPAILLSPNPEFNKKLPAIVCDHNAIGKMAAEHLIDRGLKHFAYCGLDDVQHRHWVQERANAFGSRLADAGYKFDFYKLQVYRSQIGWEETQKRLDHWLESIPKPTGIMVCNDLCGVYVQDSCKRLGLRIPEQVAVIGVDNDEMLCDLISFPLTSIALDTVRSGYDAAELLARLMDGEKMDGQQIIVNPTHIVVRQSSDILKIDDQDVSEALQIIQQHAKESIQSGEIADLLQISRQALHKRFMNVLGRSVHDEIRRVRSDLILKMLVETNQPIERIATKLGFSSIKHLSRYFKTEKGVSPSEYRKEHGQK